MDFRLFILGTYDGIIGRPCGFELLRYPRDSRLFTATILLPYEI